MKFLFKILTVILLLSSTVFADEKSNYEILGNKRISDQTILSIIEFKKNKNYNIDDLNNFQKNYTIQIILAKFLLKLIKIK